MLYRTLRGVSVTSRTETSESCKSNGIKSYSREHVYAYSFSVYSIFHCSTLIEAVVASGVLPRLVSLMGHSELLVVVPALRVTGNIISGTERHTQAALDAGALPFITPLLTHAKRNVRREACWTISNVAAGTKPQISQMMATPGLSAAVLQQLKHGDWNVKKEVSLLPLVVASLQVMDRNDAFNVHAHHLHIALSIACRRLG